LLHHALPLLRLRLLPLVLLLLRPLPHYLVQLLRLKMLHTVLLLLRLRFWRRVPLLLRLRLLHTVLLRLRTLLRHVLLMLRLRMRQFVLLWSRLYVVRIPLDGLLVGLADAGPEVGLNQASLHVHLRGRLLRNAGGLYGDGKRDTFTPHALLRLAARWVSMP